MTDYREIAVKEIAKAMQEIAFILAEKIGKNTFERANLQKQVKKICNQIEDRIERAELDAEEADAWADNYYENYNKDM